MRRLIWCLGLAVVAATALAAEPPSQITCTTEGKNFHCTSVGAEEHAYLPFWLLHAKPKQGAYGLEFTAASTKKWTYLTVDFYPNGIENPITQACIQTRLIDGRAKFRECPEKVVPTE